MLKENPWLHCSHAICASENTVTPSTPKKSVRVYIALRGSDSHEAYNRLQFFFRSGPDRVSNWNDFHVAVLIITFQSQDKCYLNCSIDMFWKFIKMYYQIVFCKLHLIIVQYLPKYHCDDFHVVLLYHF